LLTYRASFINSLISAIGFGIISFLMIVLLTAQTPVIFGWKREELMLMMGVYNILIGGLFNVFITSNFHLFAENIDRGRLDYVLLRPIDSQFILSCLRISYAHLARVIMGVVVCFYVFQLLHLSMTLPQLLSFFIFAFFGLMMVYSLWYIVMTLSIWNTQLSNLVDLMYHMNDLSRFPPQMYNVVRNYLFFIIPYTFIIVSPLKVLLRKVTVYDAAGLIFFAFFLFYFSRRFWQFALRYYTSASS
jgi:ABC-2 type transport system permease protein